jgi:thioredoxin 2
VREYELEFTRCPARSTSSVPPATASTAFHGRTRPRRQKCGRCSASLFSGKPVELGGERFKRHITRNEIPVVVDFWAPWCGPCRIMAPIFDKAAQEVEPAACSVKVNVDADPRIASEFSIKWIPALFVFKDGQIASRQAGMMDPTSLRRWIAGVSRK